jgi:flagellar protein FlgJ
MGLESIGVFQFDKTRFEAALPFTKTDGSRTQVPPLPTPHSPPPNFSTLLENTLAKPGDLQTQAPHPPIKVDKTDKLYEQCEALETYFLKTLISAMRKTVDKSSELTDTGFAGGMYEDMLYDEYTKSFAKNSGFGFADMAYLELTGQRGKVINQKL